MPVCLRQIIDYQVDRDLWLRAVGLDLTGIGNCQQKYPDIAAAQMEARFLTLQSLETQHVAIECQRALEVSADDVYLADCECHRILHSAGLSYCTSMSLLTTHDILLTGTISAQFGPALAS